LSAPYDQIVSIDFETVWDRKTGYSLSVMTTEEYIRHERFHAFGACVHVYGSDEPIEWVRGRDLPEYLQQYDWGRTAILAHNAQFDVSILGWEYDIHPCFIFDTLSMALLLRSRVLPGTVLPPLRRGWMWSMSLPARSMPFLSYFRRAFWRSCWSELGPDLPVSKSRLYSFL